MSALMLFAFDKAGDTSIRAAVADQGLAGREAVVLLHGMARSSRSMNRMAKALVAAGYAVYSMSYPSTKKTVQQIAAEDLVPLLEKCQTTKPKKIHFVAHSLGNIVLRQYFATHTMANAGRIVMLGPPNHGSEVVDKIGDLTLFDWINGPAGHQLGTGSNSLPNQLPAPPVEVGVIAGTRSINWILSGMIPGPDDGKVAVARTKLKGMKDFAVVATAHPFLMQNRKVIRMTLSFLRYGYFEAGTSDKAAAIGAEAMPQTQR
jgi:pimeloyl-ACP methyl ester carboxylesterase